MNTKNTQLKELTSHSYRELQPGKWAKPVGKSLLVYDLDSGSWSCLFKGLSGETLCGGRKTYDPEEIPSLSSFLAHCECFHGRYDIPAVTDGSNFGFLTKREEFEYFLA